MTKLQRLTLNQRVYLRLQQMILTGEIPIGAQLEEQALAEVMDVSRTPVREAIGHLVKEGLVEYRPYRGNFVRTFSVEQVDDLFQVRQALEALAVRLAISKLTQEHLHDIRQILDEVQQALACGDMVAYSDADRRFHNFLVQLSENQALIDILDRLGLHIQMIRSVANQDMHVVERTAIERELIFSALERQDADTAAELMAAHIEDVRQAVVAQFAALEQVAVIA